MEEKNARIEYTRLHVEDHGILTFHIGLKFDGCGQSFGGYALDGGRPRSWVSCEWLRALLEAVGATSWEKLEGMHVRARWAESHFGGPVVSIGHIIEDKWFTPSEIFAKERA